MYKCEIDNFVFAYIIGGCNVLSFNNIHFSFNKTGYFRLFDNAVKDGNRLFINIRAQSPNYSRWQQWGYATDIYILNMETIQ